MDSVPSYNRIIFDKISKGPITSYLLDYVTREYEAIISCPTSNKRHRSDSVEDCYNHSKSSRLQMTNSGLPSPPLSSPESDYSYGYSNNSSSHISRPPTPPNNSISQSVPLRSYIESVVEKSRIDTGTLLTSLSYARRLKSKLASTSKGMECTHHRIFLATLIIASKYIHDTALKNKYWVTYAQMFSASEINLMEKQLLQLLDYNLEIKWAEYNVIVNDTVQVYFQNNYAKESLPPPPPPPSSDKFHTYNLLNRLNPLST